MSGIVVGEIMWAFVALLLIVGACELFTNGIEWFGRKLNLSEGVVGSILAAVGTALPETIVPIVAILFVGGEGGHDVGIGGILGAPFMLSTLAFFLTGLSVFIFARRRRPGRRMPVNARVLRRDVGAFLLVYAGAIGASFLPVYWAKVLVAVVLVGAYVGYVAIHFREEEPPEDHSDELRALYFAWRNPKQAPRLRYTVLQTAVALGAIFFGARVFVGNLTEVCQAFSVDARLIALIVVPIATELPEKFNSILWVRQGKDTLAIGNITGAMVFQSCIPVAVGLLFTSWELRFTDLVSAVVALVSGGILYVSLVWTRHLSPWVLMLGIVGYGVFIALAVL